MKIIRWIKHKRHWLFLKISSIGLLVSLGNYLSGNAQSLLLHEGGGIPPEIEKQYFSDSLSRESFLQELLTSLQLKGYPMAFVQSKTFYGDTLEVKLEAGDAFTWVSLRKGNLEERLSVDAGFVEEAFQQRPLDFGNLK